MQDGGFAAAICLESKASPTSILRHIELIRDMAESGHWAEKAQLAMVLAVIGHAYVELNECLPHAAARAEVHFFPSHVHLQISGFACAGCIAGWISILDLANLNGDCCHVL